MTPEAQRIAIATACGWTCINDTGLRPVGFDPAKGNQPAIISMQTVPDFCNDLNAMHEAEKLFDTDAQAVESMRYQYSHALYFIVVPAYTQPFRASAAQRAEAFLRCLNLWKD